jgi:RHS repeat-associated protein
MIRYALMSIALLLVSAPTAHAATVTYVHTDSLGSPVMETDTQGNIVREVDHRPYGEQVLGASQNGPGFTGHYRDVATDLVYMQQRYYDPAVGRFASRDPIGTDGSASNFNRYWYANNSPYNFADPDGRESLDMEAVVSLFLIREGRPKDDWDNPITQNECGVPLCLDAGGEAGAESGNAKHGTDFAKELGGNTAERGSVDVGDWRPDRPWGNSTLDISKGAAALQGDVAKVVGGTMAPGAAILTGGAAIEAFGWKKALYGVVSGINMLVKATARPGMPAAEIPTIPPAMKPTATRPTLPTTVPPPKTSSP